PNQVTPEEFNRLTDQFTAIKRGETDLQIDTSGMKPKEAEAFKNGTMSDISSLMATSSGREMLNALTNNMNDMNPEFGDHHITTIGQIDAKLNERTGKMERDAGNAETVWKENPNITDPNQQEAANLNGTDARVKYMPGESAMVPGTNTLGTSDTIL